MNCCQETKTAFPANGLPRQAGRNIKRSSRLQTAYGGKKLSVPHTGNPVTPAAWRGET
ncbi:MAG: hypothetical protein JW749_11545 [Sedimentisphaerales bacterium]|nr:hypothetical protein [Sedimentisphaerales bacterium]